MILVKVSNSNIIIRKINGLTLLYEQIIIPFKEIPSPKEMLHFINLFS